MSFSSGGGQALGDAVLVLRTDQAPLDRGLAAAGASVNRATSSMQTTVDRRMVAMGSSMQRVGGSMTRYITTPILGLAAAAGDLGIKFQASMEMIHTQAGAPQAEVQKLTDKVLALGKSVPFGPNQLAQSLFRIESVGLRGSKAMDALKQSADLAAVGQANLDDTTKALVQVYFTGIKGIGSFNNVVAELNATVGAGDMHLQDLTLALGEGILPAAKVAGLGLKDVLGAIAVFGDETKNVGGWTSQFATALHYLYAPTTKAATAMNSIGLGSDQLAKDLHKPQGLLVALQDLKTHLETLPGGVNGVQAAQVLGSILPGGRGRVLLVLLNQLDRYQQKLKQIGNTTSQFNGDLAKTQQTTAYKVHQAWSSIQADLIQVGDKLLPTIINVAKDAAGLVSSVVNDFTKLPKGMQNAIITGGLIVAGIGPAMKLLGVFTSGIGRLATIAGKLPGVGGALAGKITSQVATMEVADMNVAAMTGGFPAAGALPAAGAAGAAGETAAVTEAGGGGAAVATAGISGLSAVAALVAGGATVFLTADAFRAVGGPPSLHQYLDALGVSKPPQGGPGVPTQATTGTPMGIPAVPGSVNQQPGTHYSAGAAPSTYLNPKGFGPTANYAQIAKDINATGAALLRLQSGKASVTQTAVALQNLAKQAAKAHDVGNEFGNAFGAILLKSKNVGSQQVMAMIAELNRLTPAAGKSAADAMIQMSRSLEASGKVPVGSTIKLVDEMSQKYDLLKNLSGKDFTQLAQQAGQTMDKLQQKIANSTGQQRQQAVAQYNRMHSEVIATLSHLAGDVNVKMSAIKGTVTHNSATAAIEGNTNFQKFASAVYAYMNSGAINASAATALIINKLNTGLKQLGQKPLTPVQVEGIAVAALQNSGAKAPGGGAYAGTSFAQGGMVEIGRPGTPGRDNVPVTVIAGEGETAMIANRHQRPRMEQWARMDGYAGLADFFARNDRPNYMAGGGLLPGALSRPVAGPSGGGASGSGYVYPFPGLTPGRTDQGYDLSGSGPLYALGSGTVVESGLWPGWPGRGGLVYRLDSGSRAGMNVYYMENVQANVGSGSHVSAGQPIATLFSGYPHLEAGWANSSASGPLTPYNGAPDGTPMPGGINFRAFVEALQSGGALPSNIGGSVGAVAAKIWKALTAPKVSGSGGYTDVIRGSLAKLTAAANAYGKKATAKWNASHAATAGGGQTSAGGTYNRASLEALWTQVGGNPADQLIASAVALAESAGDPNASNVNSNGSIDRGLWQINSIWGALSTFDPTGNANAAKQISKDGTDWTPWVTYNTGAYQQFMARGGLIPLLKAMARGGLVSFDSGMTVESDGVGPSHGDPYYQNQTAYANGRLNADKTNFTALFDGFRGAHGISFGDIENVHYGKKNAFGIVGDSAGGGSGIHGEGSVRLAASLGIPSSPVSGGTSSGVHYVIAPGSHQKSHGSIDQHVIDRVGAQIFGTKQPHHSHGHPHQHKHPHGGKPSHKHPHGHHHKDKDGKGKPTPVPTKGIPGVFNIPGHGAGIGAQYRWLTELLDSGSTAPWGVPVLSELLSYWPGAWAVQNPTASSIMSSPSSAIITQDAAGNPILPYLDTKDVALARKWLSEQIFWEAGLVRDYESAVPVSNRVSFDLRAEIAKKKHEIDARKRKIRKNLEQISDLNRKINHNNKWIGRTQKLMQNVPTGTSPSQGAGATKPDTAKINRYKAHIGSLRKEIHGWQGQIEGITDQNEKLGGKGVTNANQASGGQIGKIGAQITPLQTMLGNVSNPSGTYSQDALVGLTGVGGSLGPEITNLRTLQAELKALDPSSLSKLLANAQAQASGSLSQTKNSLLLQQEQELRQELAVSQAQYGTLNTALANLPPFGGSFATGGIVPGMTGEARTVIAHGGERITPAGDDGTPEFHFHFRPGTEWLRDFIDIRVEAKTREQARLGARVLPGAGGGRRY